MSNRIAHTYDNGLRIIYEKSKLNTPITAYHILCNFGSNNEPDQELYGAAHFIEHMVFKGSPRYKTLTISEYFDKIGASFNAFTTKKYTAYYTTCGDKFVPHTLLLFSEMLLHAEIKNGQQYENEKNVVTEEMLMKQNNPINVIVEETEKLIYNGTPYSKPIDTFEFHKKENHLPHKKVIELYRQYYVQSNMIISIVSNLSFNKIKKIIDKSAFNHPLTKKNIISSPFSSNFSSYSSQITTIYKPNQSNVILSIGFKIGDYLDLMDYCCLKLLELILSKLKSSKIFTTLREKNGLIYGSSILINTNEFGENGTFIIICQLDPNRLFNGIHNAHNAKGGVLELLFDILENLVKHGVTTKELKIAKGNMEGQLLSQMQNISAISLLNGLDILYDCDKCVSVDRQYRELYEKIDVQQMHQVIRKYIQRDNMKIVVLGAHKSYPKLASFISNIRI